MLATKLFADLGGGPCDGGDYAIPLDIGPQPHLRHRKTDGADDSVIRAPNRRAEARPLECALFGVQAASGLPDALELLLQLHRVGDRVRGEAVQTVAVDEDSRRSSGWKAVMAFPSELACGGRIRPTVLPIRMSCGLSTVATTSIWFSKSIARLIVSRNSRFNAFSRGMAALMSCCWTCPDAIGRNDSGAR